MTRLEKGGDEKKERVEGGMFIYIALIEFGGVMKEGNGWMMVVDWKN